MADYWGDKHPHFFVDYLGEGFGRHPVFENLGVWNIFLVCSQHPSQLQKGATPDPYPTHTSMIGPAVGGAYQQMPGEGGAAIWELALALKPVEFVELLENFPGFIPRMYIDTLWLGGPRDRALELEGVMSDRPAKVLPTHKPVAGVGTVISLSKYRELKKRGESL